MHQKTRETLDDINRIEQERRVGLANRVMSFIGREFRRQFPKNKLELIVGLNCVQVWVDGTVYDEDELPADFDFIFKYLADVQEITDGYARGLPESITVEPGTSKSQVAITALDNLNVEDCERAHNEADSILLAYLSQLGHQQVVDAYQRVVERASWW